jgi:hypothetical protein
MSWLRKKNRYHATTLPPYREVIKKTLDPEWNETYEFVGVRKSSVLRVECYDRDVGYVTNSKVQGSGCRV